MSELPIVERVNYRAPQRLRDLGLALLCFAAPFIYIFFYSDEFVFFHAHLLQGDLGLFNPFVDLPDEPSFFRPFRLVGVVYLVPVFGINYLVQVLFKADETWTITESTISVDRRHLIGRSNKSWSTAQISKVRLRRQALDLTRDNRFSLEVTLRSGEVLNLPSKRLLTSAQRIQAELESLAGIG